MAKKNGAIDKHLTEDMTVGDCLVIDAFDGAEVKAIDDDKFFKPTALSSGGYIQCLHYRYTSSLKE
jgi:hypothetical protein